MPEGTNDRNARELAFPTETVPVKPRPDPGPEPDHPGPLMHRPGEDRRPLRRPSPTDWKGARDIDSQERVLRIRALQGAIPGAVLGFLLGRFGSIQWGWGGGIVLAVTLLGGVATYSAILWILHLSGRAASKIYHPSGSSTPRRREYSQAESFAARGDPEAAITAFELAIAEDGSDPTPYLRIARLYRDELKRFDNAAAWFKRALRDARMPAGTATLTRRELLELYEGKMGDPEKAAPMLARMAEELRETEEGDWAREELARIKRLIAERPELG